MKNPKFRKEYKIISSEDLLKDHAWRKALQKVDMKGAAGMAIAVLRAQLGLTQEQLAKLVGTTQSGIARAEGRNRMLSERLLTKIARATNTKLEIKFVKF